MMTTTRVSDLRAILKQQRDQNRRIGFVPTMGNLHEGHLRLVQRAHELTDYVVTSIFVNPLQFGANEDLDKYPRTLEADKKKLVDSDNHLLFCPDVTQIYPQGLERHTKVVVPEITRLHCGASRPGHFDGVSTVVNILFNMVQPDVAVFGKKDFQQLALIQKMVKDLQVPISIEGCDTVREEDGLAKSSRNGYLSDAERDVAPALYQELQQAVQRAATRQKDFRRIEDEAAEALAAKGFRPDYFNIVDADTLEPASTDTKNITILAAAYLGQTRLIDNIQLTE